MNAKHTGGPWQSQHAYDLSGEYTIIGNVDGEIIDGHTHYSYTLICEVYDNENREEDAANAHLIAEAPAMLEALREGVRAIGDHNAPIDCYATGPVTGNPFRDLVQCPACSFLAMAEPILARIDGSKS